MEDLRLRVLLAEDMNEFRESLAYFLRELGGHSVTEAADGEQAWRLFQAEPFDCDVTNFLMDPALPDFVLARGNPLNGDGFARRIRASGSTVPIIVYSGAPEDVREAFAGIDGVVITNWWDEVVKLLTVETPRHLLGPRRPAVKTTDRIQ